MATQNISYCYHIIIIREKALKILPLNDMWKFLEDAEKCKFNCANTVYVL